MFDRRRSLRRVSFVPDTPGAGALAVSRGTLAVLTALFAVVTVLEVTVPLRVQAGAYLLGMVAMNLPHGGFEHFDNLRRRAPSFQVRYLLAYLAGIAAFVGLFFLAPVAGLALALCVAMAKGGQGGLYVLDATSGTDHLRTRFQRGLAATVRGGAVMLVPIVAWPATFETFSALMVGVFDPTATTRVVELLGTIRLPVAVAYGGLLAVHLLLGYRRSAGTESYLADAGESLLLTAYFAVVPVVLAVGLYFPFWYSARQVARTSAVEDPDESATGPLSFLDGGDPRLVTLWTWAVFIVGALATFGLAALLWTLSPNPLGSGPLLLGLVAFWSVFVSIVALPHVVVGSWLDRDRGIWYVP